MGLMLQYLLGLRADMDMSEEVPGQSKIEEDDWWIADECHGGMSGQLLSGELKDLKPEHALASTQALLCSCNVPGSLPQEGCIIIVDSDSEEELEPFVTKKKQQKQNISCVVIDSDSEDEYFRENVRAQAYEISSEDEVLYVSSNIGKPAIDEPPIVISDDDSDFEGPVMIIDDDLCGQGQSSSNEKEMEAFDVCQHNSSAGVAELGSGENLCPPLGVAETEVEIPNEEPAPVVEQPRKRKSKTKNICVVPAVTAPKTRGPSKRFASKRKPHAAKCDKSHTGHSVCEIPGCFLHDVEKAKQYSGRKFKKNKDSLVQEMYSLFNRSVFDKKLPEKIDIGWNKKMLRTAGLCTTGETQYLKKERYAKIQISLKVCDSADRLRDTLIHEICHAASWLIDGVRDSHGDSWKFYAKKSNLVHPELPLVTRCHNYKINYKIHYECTQCKARVGRYTKSLNTDRFICAKCKGTLVMLPLTRKDGTPIAPHVRPFAKYVQENYRLVKQSAEGLSHGDVMRQLSKDYALKHKRNP
ncbi:acidic repeat-containing protein [Panthera tigris]|uniref:acidic repeat-containing protein n=1 Tax=Panthera tigris TaxID=9694 RepID=UPI001C6F6A4E|nr:acidic repeat-containing protein [Panthera tigris]